MSSNDVRRPGRLARPSSFVSFQALSAPTSQTLGYVSSGGSVRRSWPVLRRYGSGCQLTVKTSLRFARRLAAAQLPRTTSTMPTVAITALTATYDQKSGQLTV